MAHNMDGSLPAAGGEEAQLSTSGHTRGGWITFPFITATMAGLTLAAGGWMNNLIVYMIGEFHVKSIDSAQIWNVVCGCTTMFPVIGAIIADSYLGCFSVIWISSLISLLGIVLLMLTATLDSLRPPPCENSSSLCSTPSKSQYAVLYTGLALAILGVSGTRFAIGTMGADQFDKPRHQRTFWNWFIFTLYTSSAISGTAIVYVEDNVSWGWGFGLCVVANIVGLAIFLFGTRYYRHVKPQGSPFMDLARVVVATVRKRNVLLSAGSEDYYHKPHSGLTKMVQAATPTKAFKFLNRAALKTEGDIRTDGSIARLWKLCTVQQVEDLKTLIRIFPLWSTGIFLITPLAIQTSFITLQALNMNRYIGPHFEIPAGSMLVFILISTSISIVILDQFLSPTWKKLTGRALTPLQRVGIGHVMTVLSMAVSALVESKRLKIVRSHHLQDQNGNSIIPMSVLWLVPQLALAGVGEAFHLSGNVTFYYQEFPASLKSTSTALVALLIGIAFYMSTAVVGVVRRVTQWLPDNINDGRMDNVYWVLGMFGVLNFSCYLVCAWFYKCQDVEEVVVDDSLSCDE